MRNASNDQIDLSGSEVFGWYQMKYSFFRDSLDPLKNGTQGRSAWIAEAIRLAGDNGVDLSLFYGIIVAVNAYGVDDSNAGRNTVFQVGGSWGQSNWKWCNKCEGLTFAGGTGNCPAGGVHDHNGSKDYSLALNDPVFQGQDGWKWCNKCQGICFTGSANIGPCPNGGKHDHNGSGNYKLALGKVGFWGQNQWKWCNKCQGLSFSGNSTQGSCPGGGAHNHAGSGDYTMFVNGSDMNGSFNDNKIHAPAGRGINAPTLQKMSWLEDDRIFTYKISPSGGLSTVKLVALNRAEDSGYLMAKVLTSDQVYTVEFRGTTGWDGGIGKDTVLIHELRSNYTTGQRNWKWCNKCQGLTYSGSAVCPAGDVHDHSKSANYSLAWDGSGQTGWKWCTKCQALSFTGSPENVSTCPAGGAHNTNSSANYGLQLNNSKAEGQKDWKWCCKCQGLTFAASSTIGPCSVGGVHDHSGSGNYTLAWGASIGQDQWRWCSKCQGLAYDGYSVCAAGGAHTHVGSGDYSLPLDDPTASGQDKWKWCSKCYGLAYAGNPSLGPCPAKGNHDHCGSGNYTLLSGVGSDNGQNKWSWCNKCQLLAYSGNGTGLCPAGGHHDHTGSGDYTLANFGADRAFLIKAGWQTGDVFTDKERGVRISIGAMDSAAGTATITVGPLPIVGPLLGSLPIVGPLPSSNHTTLLPVVGDLAMALVKKMKEAGFEDGSEPS